MGECTESLNCRVLCKGQRWGVSIIYVVGGSNASSDVDMDACQNCGEKYGRWQQFHPNHFCREKLATLSLMQSAPLPVPEFVEGN